MGDKQDPDERVLEDDYPIYHGYYYVVDGEVSISNINGTVADFKRSGAKEVRRCDAIKRGLPL